LKSSSAAFQLPPSSIDRAWANKVVFMRSLSSLEYFQASLLPSIYVFKIHFSSETSASHLILRYTSAIHQLLSCRLGSYPSHTNPHTTTSQAFPKHTPTQLNQRARTSLVRSFRPSIHQKENLENPLTLSKPCLVEPLQLLQMRWSFSRKLRSPHFTDTHMIH
jgi:hypothetical protein